MTTTAETPTESPPSWECSACSLRVSWAEGFTPRIPVGWSEESGEWRCLRCRRAAAGDAAEAEAKAAGAVGPDIGRWKSRALVEFELDRNPSRRSGEIAQILRLPPRAVAARRKELGR